MARSLSRRRMPRQSAIVIGAAAAVGSLPSLAQAVQAAQSSAGLSAADVAALDAFVGTSNDTANTQTLLVPANGAWDVDFGLLAQPRRHGRRRPIRQQVNDPLLLQIDEDRAVLAPCAPGPSRPCPRRVPARPLTVGSPAPGAAARERWPASLLPERVGPLDPRRVPSRHLGDACPDGPFAVPRGPRDRANVRRRCGVDTTGRDTRSAVPAHAA